MRTAARAPGGYLIRNQRYGERFKCFAESYYRRLVPTTGWFEANAEKQAQVLLFEKHRLLFSSLHSCYLVDHLFPDRAQINKSAVAYALHQMRVQRENPALQGARPLGIGLWHHPVAGTGKIRDCDFLQLLRGHGIRLCLTAAAPEDPFDEVYAKVEGVHTIRTSAFHPGDQKPGRYNLIEIDEAHRFFEIHTRWRRHQEGAWESHAIWGNRSQAPVGHWRIDL